MEIIKSFRLEDQYIPFGLAIASGLLLSNYDVQIVLWALSFSLISIFLFTVNEIVDSKDSDTYSWNPVHNIQSPFSNRFLIFLSILLATLGLVLSHIIGLLYWALIALVFGLFYSVKPFRLKNRFVLDIVCQIFVWLFIPLSAPLWLKSQLTNNIWFVLSIALALWGPLFAYQIADY